MTSNIRSNFDMLRPYEGQLSRLLALAERELAEDGNQPNLNLSKVKEFEIPLPPLQVQTEIVHRVEALFDRANRIEARAQAQRLSPSTLAKAFRGELVPQDPTDEPATKLLRRVAESRSAPTKKARVGRTAAN